MNKQFILKICLSNANPCISAGIWLILLAQNVLLSIFLVIFVVGKMPWQCWFLFVGMVLRFIWCLYL
jgi:hypothetical protein